MMRSQIRSIQMAIFICLVSALRCALADDTPKIFPIPQKMNLSDGELILAETTWILIPENASKGDLFLARLLMKELSDHYLLALKIMSSNTIPSTQKFILMGTTSNELVYHFCTNKQYMERLAELGDEGYILEIEENGVIVASISDAGALYGFQSLRQLITERADKIVIPRGIVEDYPQLLFRGIRLYIPGRDNFPFFKRFISDFMSLYKFNKVILEVNGVMRLDRHPEINVGSMEFANEMNYSRRGRPEGPGNQFQNSSHHDAGDGQILEKDEVTDLVDYLNEFHIEVIPEIPSLTHSYYLLAKHRELAEIANAEWPDTYCPSNPESYKLLFDVFDEYIEVIQPKMIHLGKDEWRMPVEICPLCKDKDYRELFVKDIQKIYTYLSRKGIKVAMWGDHLLTSVRNSGLRDRKSSSGYEYKIPGAITPEQVEEFIPKDILIFNWFWGDKNNDLALENFGFKQVYGNFRPNISIWEIRNKWPSVMGGAPSSWAGTTEFNFGKDLLYDYLGCANLLWSGHHLKHEKLAHTVRQLVPKIRRYLSGEHLPSEDNNKIIPLDIGNSFNTPDGQSILGVGIDNLITGEVGDKKFILPEAKSPNDNIAVVVGTGEGQKTNMAKSVNDIAINKDASSLIFLHACVKEAGNEKAYRTIYNFDDTADLLGWYQIEYDDGYVNTIPIRYGVNILDVNVCHRDSDEWQEGKTGAPQNRYSYLAEFIECSRDSTDSRAFFSYEWRNPRFGKTIKNITLNGIESFRNTSEKEIPNNAIILLAISYSKKRPVPDVRIE